MGSVIGEGRHLEDGDCSLLILPPKYKRRKVSAVRDFPRGCGPNAAPINVQKKEGKDDGHKVDDLSNDVEGSDEAGGDHCQVERKEILKGEKLESQSRDIPVCPVRVDLETSGSVNCSKLENENQTLPFENPNSSQDCQTMKEKCLSKDTMCDTSKDLTVMVESPSASKDTGIVNPKESADGVVENKIVDEGTSVLLCVLPHYPIPSNVVLKERKYPPRKRVSAVRNFPIGCGRSAPRLRETEGKQLVGSGTNAKIQEAAAPNQIRGKFDAENDYTDKLQVVVYGRNGNPLEKRPESDKIAPVDMVLQAPLFSKSSENKGQEEIPEDNNDEQHREEMEHSRYAGKDESDMGCSSGGLGKEIMVYVKDKHKRKKSNGVSSSNVELPRENIASVENGKGVVFVQGLMSALSCPWRQGKEAIKSSPSGTSGKTSKGKKCHGAEKHTHKRAINISKDNADSMMITPFLQDLEIDEVSRPLARRDEEDSSENEEPNDFQLVPRKRDFDVILPPTFAGSSSERSVRSKVRETLRLFQGVVRKLLQEEETKPKDQENVGKRIDLRAAGKLREHGKYINTEKLIGDVPGVEVGDIFNYRIELAIIGLHTPLQSGIDSIKQGKQPIAISVVASGGYDNDVESSDTLIYTGQGGNPSGPAKQPEDQKLERGNLALKNSIDKKNPVRVIRGFKEAKPVESGDGRPKMVATYTYDGLYTVEKYWHDLGPHGKLVYKFELRRMPGQRELAWKEVKLSKKFKVREGRCVDDISEGKEKPPICAVNTIDDEKPPPFTYINSMMYPDWCQPIPPKGCDCKDGCSDSQHCACTVKNGGEIPYNYGGAIVEARPLVYECGRSCKCPSSCQNRVSQNGIKLPLEIFKTDSRGWGVRSLSSVPSGSFICEYIGELLDDKEAEQRAGSDEYLFDIGQNYSDSTLSDELSALMPDLPSSSTDVVENVGFTIDAARYGNIGRFINHSCSPNLYAQNVLYDHEDKRIPHIMLFAAENIPPLQELTYHYNYTIDQVFDSEGNIKRKNCYCGSSECTGRMY